MVVVVVVAFVSFFWPSVFGGLVCMHPLLQAPTDLFCACGGTSTLNPCTAFFSHA